jgi:hypothetical protein
MAVDLRAASPPSCKDTYMDTYKDTYRDASPRPSGPPRGRASMQVLHSKAKAVATVFRQLGETFKEREGEGGGGGGGAESIAGPVEMLLRHMDASEESGR